LASKVFRAARGLAHAVMNGVLKLLGVGGRVDQQGLVGDLEGFGCGGLVGARAGSG